VRARLGVVGADVPREGKLRPLLARGVSLRGASLTELCWKNRRYVQGTEPTGPARQTPEPASGLVLSVHPAIEPPGLARSVAITQNPVARFVRLSLNLSIGQESNNGFGALLPFGVDQKSRPDSEIASVIALIEPRALVVLSWAGVTTGSPSFVGPSQAASWEPRSKVGWPYVRARYRSRREAVVAAGPWVPVV